MRRSIALLVDPDDPDCEKRDDVRDVARPLVREPAGERFRSGWIGDVDVKHEERDRDRDHAVRERLDTCPCSCAASVGGAPVTSPAQSRFRAADCAACGRNAEFFSGAGPVDPVTPTRSCPRESSAARDTGFGVHEAAASQYGRAGCLWAMAGFPHSGEPARLFPGTPLGFLDFPTLPTASSLRSSLSWVRVSWVVDDDSGLPGARGSAGSSGGGPRRSPAKPTRRGARSKRSSTSGPPPCYSTSAFRTATGSLLPEALNRVAVGVPRVVLTSSDADARGPRGGAQLRRPVRVHLEARADRQSHCAPLFRRPPSTVDYFGAAAPSQSTFCPLSGGRLSRGGPPSIEASPIGHPEADRGRSGRPRRCRRLRSRARSVPSLIRAITAACFACECFATFCQRPLPPRSRHWPRRPGAKRPTDTSDVNRDRRARGKRLDSSR